MIVLKKFYKKTINNCCYGSFNTKYQYKLAKTINLKVAKSTLFGLSICYFTPINLGKDIFKIG